MAQLGLDGRSFVMMLMGFGCNVPAAMGTRIMRSRGLRLLTMLIIPVSLCSARLQVFLFLTAAHLRAGARRRWVIFSLYVMSFVAALVTAVAVQGPLPQRRAASCSSCRRTACRRCGRSRCAPGTRCATSCAARRKFIVAGVILIWLLTNLPAGRGAGRRRTPSPACSAGCLQPVLAPLGIDERLTVALIFGFVAKEVLIGAFAVIYGLEGQALAARPRAQHGLGAGVQLHAVHADLHALPVDDRDAARRGAEQRASPRCRSRGRSRSRGW